MFQLFHITQDEKTEIDSDNIYGDDTIQIIKEKIVEKHNKGRSEKKSPDEIYLYGTITSKLEQRKLFERSINITSRSSVLKEKDVILMNNNNNLSVPVKNYTFEEFEKLKIKSNINQLVSLSQSLLMGQKKYLYSVDPQNEVFDKIINNEDDTQVISLDNYLLLKFGNIKKLMYCFPQDVINSDMSETKQEFMFKLYFPKIYKQNIKSLQEYNNNKQSFKKSTLDNNTELLMKYLHNEKLNNVNKGISKLYFIIHPEINMRLPMELIFKLVNSVKSIPLIKYDPGNKLENRYRLYTGNKLSKNGKKIPYIVSNNGYKSGKLNLVRRRLVNENRVGFFIEEDGIEIYCQFIEDGNIEIKLNVKKSKRMSDIISCLERNLNNKILYSLNSYLKKSGYTFPMFVDLNNEYVEIVRLDYEYELESEDYDFDLKEYENCLTHIFNLKNKTKYEKGSDVIELKYKKVSSYNKMTAINEFISIKLQYNSSNETIISELQSNFKLNRKDAVDYFTKFKQESEIQLDAFANKSLQFIESNGFDVKIEMKQNEKLEQKLFINVYNINNEKYISYIDKYVSFLTQIIEDDVEDHYKKLCKKIEIKKDDKKEASLSAKVIIDLKKEKEEQLNELEKLRGSDNEEESDDDGEIDAFARRKREDTSSDDDDESSDDENWGFGGGGNREFTARDTLVLDENAEVQSMINKIDIKQNQFGGKIPAKKVEEIGEKKEDPATIVPENLPLDDEEIVNEINNLIGQIPPVNRTTFTQDEIDRLLSDIEHDSSSDDDMSVDSMYSNPEGPVGGEFLTGGAKKPTKELVLKRLEIIIKKLPQIKNKNFWMKILKKVSLQKGGMVPGDVTPTTDDEDTIWETDGNTTYTGTVTPPTPPWQPGQELADQDYIQWGPNVVIQNNQQTQGLIAQLRHAWQTLEYERDIEYNPPPLPQNATYADIMDYIHGTVFLLLWREMNETLDQRENVNYNDYTLEFLILFATLIIWSVFDNRNEDERGNTTVIRRGIRTVMWRWTPRVMGALLNFMLHPLERAQRFRELVTAMMLNDLVLGFIGGAVPTNNNNLEEKMDIVAEKVNEDGTIIDGDDVVMEEEEEDEEINDDDVLNITAMWDIDDDALLEPGHGITAQEITAMNEMEDINTDHINEIAQNEDSVWNVVGRALLPGDFVEYTLMSHDNPDILILREESFLREIPEGHPAFVLDDPWASDDDDDVPEELAAWLEQQDNHEEPDAEMFGGAKKELTYVLEGRQNYFVNRLRNRYEDIAIKENKRGFQSYVRSCPSNMKRIPVILNQKEYNEMKDEIKDEKAISYKDDKGEDHWFVCPRFWCFKDPNKKFTGKPLTLKQIEEGACGGLDALIPLGSKTIPDGKSIYEFTDEKYHNGKPRNSDEWKESYKKLYPGFMNKKNSKGLCMPCCFNMTDKFGNYRLSASRKRMEDECCEEEGKCAHYKYDSKKKGKSRVFVAPIKGKQLLREGQLGYLPESLENFFQFNSEKICQVSKRDTKLKPNTYCMLRVGVKTKQNINNTFLSSIALAVKEDIKKINLNKLKIDEIVKEMKSKIKRNSNFFVKFLIANKGNLYKTFFDEKSFDFKEKEIKSKDRDIYNQMKISYGEKRAKKEYSKINHAIDNFLDYIEHGENVNYEYLWDLITMPIKEGGLFFKNGLNLLIFNNPRDDPIDKIELICPKGSQYNNYNYSKKRPLLMLYKVNNTYEPIVFYTRGKKEDIKIKTTIQNFTKPENILKKEGKKIWDIINYISQDIEEKCQKYPNNDLYFSKYTINIPLKKLIKKLGKNNIKYQIINEFYETIGVLTTESIYVPCEPSPISSKIEKRFVDRDLSNIIQTIDYPEQLKNLDIKLENGEKLHIPDNGIIEKDGVIVGYRTNTNQLVLINPEIDLSINDYGIDKVIKTGEKNMDKERIESIKKIKMAKNYYIFFRNLFKMKINELDNTKIKEDILKIIENSEITKTYVNKMDEIIGKLKELMDEDILSFDLSENDALSLCEYLKISEETEEDIECIGVTGSDNIHHFPKYNLINEQENEELYFEKLSDELIRYEKIKKYIFLKNKYMNFDIVNYKISNSEILIMETTLLNILDKWKNDELMTTINYIKYKNVFDKVTKDDKSNYTNQYRIDIKEIPSYQDKLISESESDLVIDFDDDDENKKNNEKNIYIFNDGFGDNIRYEFAKDSKKPKAFAINWFLKYVLISPPKELEKYVEQLKEIDGKKDRLKKTKEIFEGEMKGIILKLFQENWDSIEWNKEETGRSMFQGWNRTYTDLWNLHLSKNTQSKPSNNNKATGLHFSVYRKNIGKGEYNKDIVLKKLIELNSLNKKINPLFK